MIRWISSSADEEPRQVVLYVVAGQVLAALVHASCNHSPAVIPEDVLTYSDAEDDYAKGTSRALSPALGFPALSVRAGLTPEGCPVGIECLGRSFSEGLVFGFGYGCEEGTGHRRRPDLAPLPSR